MQYKCTKKKLIENYKKREYEIALYIKDEIIKAVSQKNFKEQFKNIYYSVLAKYREVEDVKIYFVIKNLIFPFEIEHHREKSFKDIKEISNKILSEISNDKKVKIEEFFSKHNFVISRLNLKKHCFIIYFFQDDLNNNNLIIKVTFDTYLLEKDLESVKNTFLLLLISILMVFLFFRIIIFYISKILGKTVAKMEKNEPIENKSFFIKELEDLVLSYNEYRQRLNQEIEKNKNLLLENKRFIVDTVHQLKTPLSIITLNSDFLKMNLKDEEAKEILDEIEAAIAMLTNSYEDLSYLASNKVVEYKPANIDISNILKSRIVFFTPLAKTRTKKLMYEIDENLYFNINKVEFERLVDNNISNAIEYSKKELIKIELKKEQEKIVLKFISYGDEIKNPEKIFEKNYREKEYKRGLGIGLNIVKNICEKYSIKYNVFSKEGKNIFEYIFCYNCSKKQGEK